MIICNNKTSIEYSASNRRGPSAASEMTSSLCWFAAHTTTDGWCCSRMALSRTSAATFRRKCLSAG